MNKKDVVEEEEKLDGEEEDVAIVEEEIIAGDEKADGGYNQEVEAPDSVKSMFSLEELIKNHIESISKLREEIKQVREMFEDSFNNNPTYKEASDRLKDVAKSRNSVRQQIAKQPSVGSLVQKLKDFRFDLNEQQKTLSDLLQDYHEQTGATQIEDRTGQIMEIVSTARLVKKNSKYNP